jgi:hypothetical protein
MTSRRAIGRGRAERAAPHVAVTGEQMSSIESRPRIRATRLLVVSAAIELGAGLTLLVAPVLVIRLLFGRAVDVFPAVGIARVAGVALLSLAAACWWARHEDRSATASALVGAMLIYNSAVVTLVIVGALGGLGPLQWALVIVHGALAIWCARVVADRRT